MVKHSYYLYWTFLLPLASCNLHEIDGQGRPLNNVRPLEGENGVKINNVKRDETDISFQRMLGKSGKNPNRYGKSSKSTKSSKSSKSSKSTKVSKASRSESSSHSRHHYTFEYDTFSPTFTPTAFKYESNPSYDATNPPTMGATPTVGLEKTLAPTSFLFRPSPRPTGPSVPVEICTPLDKIECCNQQSINNQESFARICANLGCSVDVCGPKSASCTRIKQNRCCNDIRKCERFDCRYSDCPL